MVSVVHTAVALFCSLSIGDASSPVAGNIDNWVFSLGITPGLRELSYPRLHLFLKDKVQLLTG